MSDCAHEWTPHRIMGGWEQCDNCGEQRDGEAPRDEAMTAPTPTAQDGERERPPDLRCDETKFWHAQLAERDETIRTQSAELAALRAQVEGLRKDAERYHWIRGNEHMDIAACWLITADTPYAPQTAEELDAAIDAALAPPQPVAKEK